MVNVTIVQDFMKIRSAFFVLLHAELHIRGSLLMRSYTKTLHVSDSSSVHHQEFFTVHTALIYVTQVLLTAWEQDQDVPFWSCSQAVSKTVWHIPMLCVEWKTPDDGQRNCPKHIEFYSENKFEKLVHLVGFSIRIYHDARSPERQIC